MNANIADEMFRHLHMPPELAITFLATFSRMEYALKVSDYAHGDQNKVEAHWDRFANDVDQAFQQSANEEVVDAMHYILGQPPRKQVLEGDRLRFQDQVIDPNQTRTQQALRFVRTIRNNLFHGGKYLPNGEQEAGRNEQLVKCALVILNHCKEQNEKVAFSFER